MGAITVMQELLRQSKSLRPADAAKFPEAVIPQVRIPANVTADSGDRDRWRCCAL
jgi:hypothetical protein